MNTTFIYTVENMVTGEKQTFEFDFDITDSWARYAAQVMEQNGGHPVELCTLTKLEEQLMDDILVWDVVNNFPDADIEDLDVYLQEEMPQELIDAAEKYLTEKLASVALYYNVNGEEVKSQCVMGLKPSIFNAMVEAVENHADTSTDFEFLKTFAPEAYKEIWYLAEEWGYKETTTRYGTPCPVEIREFPTEVYDQV